VTYPERVFAGQTARSSSQVDNPGDLSPIRPAPDVAVYPIARPEQLGAVSRFLADRRHRVLGIDCETNGEDPFDPCYRLRTVQIADDRTSLVLSAEHIGPNAIARLVREHPTWCAHYAEVDIRFLHRGAPGSIRTDDQDRPHVVDTQTVLAWYDPRTVTSQKDAYGKIPLPKGLKPSVERVLGTQLLTRAESDLHAEFDRMAPKGMRKSADRRRHGFANIPFADPRYQLYGGLDPLMTVRLYDLMTAEIERRGWSAGLAGDMWLQWQIDLSTLRGQHVDGPYARWLDAQLEAAVLEHAGHLASIGVPESGQGDSVAAAFERFGHVPEKTSPKTGKPSYDKFVLADLGKRDDLVGELARKITAVRKARKFRSTYVAPMLTALQRDGRLHPSMRAVGAITSRNSAANPPVQQLPKKDPRVRPAICAPPGWVLVSADFAQGEPRTMAALSGDRRLLADIMAGDLNSGVATAVYGDAYDPAFGQDAGTPHYLMRHRAKAGFLAACYGAQDRKLMETLGEAGPVLVESPRAGWRARYPDLFRLSDDLNNQRHVQLDNGWVIPLWDRAWLDDQGRIRDRGKPSRKGLNAAAQGTQRLLLVFALRRLVAAGWGRALQLLLHDEIVLLVHEHEAPAAAAALKDAMTMTYRGVMIECDVTVCGRSWLPRPSEFDASAGALLALPEGDDDA
jgi:DNA polymerase-1